MNINEAIKAVISRQNLNESEMHDVMNSIMTGQTTDAQIGAFLVGLSMKGETIEEITASAKVMERNGNRNNPWTCPHICKQN